jgi:hypothetical protein
MCPHTAIYILLHVCPHNAKARRPNAHARTPTTIDMSADSYIYIYYFTCPHARTHARAHARTHPYYDRHVRRLLYVYFFMCPHIAIKAHSRTHHARTHARMHALTHARTHAQSVPHRESGIEVDHLGWRGVSPRQTGLLSPPFPPLYLPLLLSLSLSLSSNGSLASLPFSPLSLSPLLARARSLSLYIDG